MASSKKIPIYGNHTIHYTKNQIKTLVKENLSSRNDPIKKNNLYFYKTEHHEKIAKRTVNISYNFTDYLIQRELGIRKQIQQNGVCEEYGMRHILSQKNIKEHQIHIQGLNKIFCSKWLNNSQVVFGTKCKKILIYNLKKRTHDEIPLLGPRNNYESHQGIHSIEINPSRTLLASQALDANNVAFYSLPTFEPYCLGTKGHQEFVFDVCWLDDQFIVSGSREGSICLWSVPDDLQKFPRIEPFYSEKYSDVPIRAFAFNIRACEFLAVTLNGFLHTWDAQTFTKKFSRPLKMENGQSCIAVKDGLIAIGIQRGTLLIDERNLKPVTKLSRDKAVARSVRSVSFKGNLLTIGTSDGFLEFYDIRNKKYLLNAKDPTLTTFLKTSKGVKERGGTYEYGTIGPYSDMIFEKLYPAIYTHCYDNSGTKLFVGGGPLSVLLNGYYASVWF